MSLEQNKQTIARFFADVNDAQHYNQLDDLCTPGVVVHDPLAGDSTGLEAFRGLIMFFGQAFTSQKTELRQFIAEGDYVAVLHTHTGVNTGAFNGLPPTGRAISVPGCDLFRLTGGQIAEFWRGDADLSLMMQLGAVPAPAAA